MMISILVIWLLLCTKIDLFSISLQKPDERNPISETYFTKDLFTFYLLFDLQ